MSYDVTTNIIGQNSASVQRDAFILKQTPPPLPSALGTVDVLPMKSIIHNFPPMPFKSLFILSQYPDPPPNKIGEEDLPGGFKRTNIISEKSSPLYDLSSGIVQLDNIHVFFDALA